MEALVNHRVIYERVKAEVLLAIEVMRTTDPDAAAYLLEHLHADDERMTFVYDGDPDRFLIPLGEEVRDSD